MAQKIKAAADHGIDVFLFDWYYNAPGTFLERPLNEGYLKAPNNSRVKFALMWANHNLGTGKGAVPRPVFDRLAGDGERGQDSGGEHGQQGHPVAHAAVPLCAGPIADEVYLPVYGGGG